MEKLFKDFPSATREQWEAVINKELKGADPASLDVKLADGLVLKPFHLAANSSPAGE